MVEQYLTPPQEFIGSTEKNHDNEYTIHYHL
jgi:hypothetical protein